MFLSQVATGIKHLHDKNLCHMDIKVPVRELYSRLRSAFWCYGFPPRSVWLVQPENIFVKNGVFKIGDMGLVTVIKGSPREVCLDIYDRNRR